MEPKLPRIQHGPFKSFLYPDYRLVWVGSTASSTANWMLKTAISWLVLEMTHSPILITFVFAAFAIPSIFIGPFAGVWADKYSRKKLLVFVWIVSCVCSIILGVLVMANIKDVWLILLLTAIIGSSMPIVFVCSQTYIYDIVGPSNALNGISLWSLGLRLVGAAGAIVGGFIIESSGIYVAIFIAAIAYGLSCITISAIKHVEQPGILDDSSVFANLKSGLSVIKGSGLLIGVVILAITAEAFGYGVTAIFPILADVGVFGVGALGLGIMNGAFGVGGVLGSIILASLRTLDRLGVLLVTALMICGLLLLALSLSNYFYITVLIIGGLGLVMASYDTLSILIIQRTAPEGMRGRLTGVLVLTFGIGPAGHVALGVITSAIGPALAIGISAIIVISITLLTFFIIKKLRSM
jgi:MFS family permease